MGIVHCNNHHLPDTGMLRECSFHFAQFHSMSSNLYLVIQPAQKFERAIQKRSHQIASSVAQTVKPKRLRRDKPLRRQLGVVEITARHTRAADI